MEEAAGAASEEREQGADARNGRRTGKHQREQRAGGREEGGRTEKTNRCQSNWRENEEVSEKSGI